MWMVLFSLTGLLAMVGSLIMPANVAARLREPLSNCAIQFNIDAVVRRQQLWGKFL